MLTDLYDSIEYRNQHLVTNDSIGLQSDTYDELSSELDNMMMDADVKYIMGSIDARRIQEMCGPVERTRRRRCDQRIYGAVRGI